MSEPPPVVAVYGPTSSGKTGVATHIARELGTEVVNCDPAQCYDGLPVLTNKPNEYDDQVALHRMVGVWSMTTEATVATFAPQAQREIDDLIATNGHAVVCGGSGMYMLSALCRLEFAGDDVVDAAAGDDGGVSRPADSELREQLGRRYDAEGGEALHAELAGLDAQAAERIHPNDRKRVIRALEAAASGGSVAPGGRTLWDAPYRHDTLVVGLRCERSRIGRNINERTRSMFLHGDVAGELAALTGERAELIKERMSSTARQIHGVQDVTALLRGEIDVEEAIHRLIVRTRQYARRQDTWARRWPGLWPVDYDARRMHPERDPSASPPGQVAGLVRAEGAQHAIRQVAGTG